MKCLNCDKETSNPKFCSRSCSVTRNNTGVRKHGQAPGLCALCTKPKYAYNRKFCSSLCEKTSIRNTQIEALHQGTFSGNPQTLRKYMLLIFGHVCMVCGLSEWTGQPIPLDVEHTDGNSSNNTLSNLKLLCLNCHGLTSTWKSSNKGQGRHKRMLRYRNGDSY